MPDAAERRWTGRRTSIVPGSSRAVAGHPTRLRWPGPSRGGRGGARRRGGGERSGAADRHALAIVATDERPQDDAAGAAGPSARPGRDRRRRPRSVPRRADGPRRLAPTRAARTRRPWAPIWPGSTSGGSTGDARPGRPARLPRGPVATVAPGRSVGQRLAAIRSFYRFATRNELCAGRPVGRDRHAAPAEAAAPGPRGGARSSGCWRDRRRGAAAARGRAGRRA